MRRLLLATSALIAAAGHAQTYENEHYCVPNGPCLNVKQEGATTPNPWWFQVASLTTSESEDYHQTIVQLVNIRSIKVDRFGVRTFTARAQLEELDKRHFMRSGDAIVEETIQVDCKNERFRTLDFRSGSSLSLDDMPVPIKNEHDTWHPLADGFVFNGLHGTAFAWAVC